MGIDKQGSKGGNYVGSFFLMFDWNAKSRKKLFSSKSDAPEQSKQKKRCDGSLPTNRLHMLDADEDAAGSSFKGSSDYSCSSSVIDEADFCEMKAPGVVARLMGLDSLPKSSVHVPYSTPLSDSFYRTERPEHCKDQTRQSSQVMHKFQAEILPPKSAKSVPLTHHKLLSPIKSGNFVASKDAARIMEAAARIIDPAPQHRPKKKQLTGGSSSVPLRVRDLKEKVQTARKPSKVSEGSQRKGESNAVKSLRGQSMSKSWNGESEESSTGGKTKGKSISLALQAKANVQKREALNTNSSRNQKEQCEISPNRSFKSQSTTQKNRVSTQNGSTALRPNNQKQNCGNLTSKSNSKGGKTVSGESSSARQRSSDTSKVNKRDMLLSSTARVTSKKRSVDGNYYGKNQKMEMDKNAKANELCFEDSRSAGTDVVSFTFTAPMTRSRPGSVGPTSSESTSSSGFPYLEHNVKGGDALGILLEQKLKELARKVEFSKQNSGMRLHDTMTGPGPTMNLCAIEGNQGEDQMCTDDQGVLEETSTSCSTISRNGKLLDHRLPSPVSVLDRSPFAESCNSSETAESNSTAGSKQCSSSNQDSYSSNTFLRIERDELSDSASSTSSRRRQRTALTFTNTRRSKLEYVKEILSNIEPMFENYALGRSNKLINPVLFDHHWRKDGTRRMLFDCVSECLELKCGRYVTGGYRLWVKSVSMVRRKERLAKAIEKEVSGWSADVGESRIDELVDKDMSSRHGRWVDFDVESFEIGLEIESRIVSALIDEVVDDILHCKLSGSRLF